MDQIPRAPSTPFINTLPALIFIITVALTLGFLALLLGTRMGLQFGELLMHPNPFAAYEMLWPGQPSSNVFAYQGRMPVGACSLVVSAPDYEDLANISNPVQVVFCASPSEEHIFGSIQILMQHNQVQHLTLFSENLSENAVLLYWGAPDAIEMSVTAQQRVLRWERNTFTAIAHVTQEGSIVNSVILTVKPDSVVKLVTLTAKE